MGMADGRAAVVVPGLRYSADRPLLMYAGLAVERRGGSVRRISWTVPQFGNGDEERARVAALVSVAVDAVAAATGVAAPGGDPKVAGVAGGTRGRRPGAAGGVADAASHR
jgi:hypothetical protein